MIDNKNRRVPCLSCMTDEQNNDIMPLFPQSCPWSFEALNSESERLFAVIINLKPIFSAFEKIRTACPPWSLLVCKLTKPNLVVRLQAVNKWAFLYLNALPFMLVHGHSNHQNLLPIDPWCRRYPSRDANTIFCSLWVVTWGLVAADPIDQGKT